MDVPNFFIVMYFPFSVYCVLFVCKCVLLPPGVNPIAVIYIYVYISYHVYVVLWYYVLYTLGQCSWALDQIFRTSTM
jgi:fructose-specific phosphotransferase system IIC component